MLLELPINIVTAIVSPIARPSPSITALTMPEKAAGMRTCKIVSQRVAPSPREAWRKLEGIEIKASRDKAVMIGKVIIAKMTPAGNIPGPVGEVLKNGTQPK